MSKSIIVPSVFQIIKNVTFVSNVMSVVDDGRCCHFITNNVVIVKINIIIRDITLLSVDFTFDAVDVNVDVSSFTIESKLVMSSKVLS